MSYSLGRSLTRVHLENGLAVALGLLTVGVAFRAFWGLPVMISALTGALCASIVDQPGPFRAKTPIFAMTVAITVAATAAVAFAKSTPLATGAVIALASFIAGLISAYGRRAIGIGVAMILALIYGLGAALPGVAAILQHTALFAAGAISYSLFALAFGFVFEGVEHRLLIGEAIRAFAQYLEAKAALYDPAQKSTSAFRALIQAHSDLTERLQAARDAIFIRYADKRAGPRVGMLLELLDAFEASLASDADIETLRFSEHRHLLRRLRNLVLALARDLDALVPTLYRRGVATPDAHEKQIAEIEEEIARLQGAPHDAAEDEALAAFRSTFSKLRQSRIRIAQLAQSMATGQTKTAHGALDLTVFMQPPPSGFSVLRAQFSLSSPTLRYAIRLMLAMTVGYALTRISPAFTHGSWVLLTTALIMRANYSITRRRRRDRIMGTLAGCLIAGAALHVLPIHYLLLVVLVCVSVAHAYGAVDYRVTALAASIGALLQLHFLAPNVHPPFFERVLDTLVGAGLSYIFSFILPSWERRDVPSIVANVVKADTLFAREALTLTPVDQAYRLARKRVLDAIANLAGAARRVADEPRTGRRVLATLNEFLGANYLYASDVASVQLLLRRRHDEIDAEPAGGLLERSRAAVTAALSARGAVASPAEERPLPAIAYDDVHIAAMSALTRRLAHIEQSARKVARLAARPLV